MNRESRLTLCCLHSFHFETATLEKVSSTMVQTRLVCDFGSKPWKGGIYGVMICQKLCKKGYFILRRLAFFWIERFHLDSGEETVLLIEVVHTVEVRFYSR